MENVRPETAETKVPSKGLAVTSLVCGMVSLVGGGETFIWLFLASCSLVKSLGQRTAFDWAFQVTQAGSSLMFVLPLLAVIFSAIPLKQGKGTDWDGKGIATAGLVTGIVSLSWIIIWVVCFVNFFAWLFA